MADKEFWRQKVTIYLYHFERKLYHAGHYLGSSDDLTRRSAEHDTVGGSKLMQARARAGIKAKIVRTWEETPRYHEVELHRQKNNSDFCPVCSGRKAFKRGIFKPKPKTKNKR